MSQGVENSDAAVTGSAPKVRSGNALRRSGAAGARALIVVILLAALAVRLGWTLTRPTDAATLEQLPDQNEYLATAQSLLDGEGLSFLDPRFGDRVFAYRTPGYPLLIAA